MSRDPLRVVFFGTPAFSVPSLEALAHLPEVEIVAVVTQPDRPAGRGKAVRYSPVKQAALALDLPVFQPTSLRKERQELFEALAKYGAFDGAVVIAFGQILPQEVLDFFHNRCVNVHASLLPRWRGAAPMQRAIMSGDDTTGVCLMKMEAGLDTGPVYSSVTVPINRSDSLEILHDKLAHEGAKLLQRDIRPILRGKLPPLPQPSEGVTYASKIMAGEALIDWSRSAESIRNSIRGLWPSPGAFTFLEGKRLKVARAEVVPLEELARSLPVGTKVAHNCESFVIRCGDGGLALLEVQLEGKQRMEASSFLRGHPVKEGTVLGQDPKVE